jgi:hypothetical protein
MTSHYAWSTTAADNDTADSGINWQELQAPDTVNNSARAMMQRGAQWRLDMTKMRASSGAANAYEITIDSSPAALVDGMAFSFVAHQANTGAATLKVNSFAAKPLRSIDGVALGASAVQSGAPVVAYYDLTNDQFLISASTGVAAGSSPNFAGITVGTDDNEPGTVTIYGGGATEAGAKVRLHNGADDDGTTDYYDLEAEDGTGEFALSRDNGTRADIRVGTGGRVTLAQDNGTVVVGEADTAAGIVEVMGSATASDEGGELRLHMAADHDGVYAYWAADAYQDDFRLFPQGGSTRFQLTPTGALRLSGYGEGYLKSDSSGNITSEALNVAYTAHPDNDKATTSGTSVTFGSIPSGTNEIVITMQGVSHNSGGLSGIPIMRLGDAGGLEASGYVSSATDVGNNQTSSTEFALGATTQNGAGAWHGTVYLFRSGGNKWNILGGVRSNGRTASLSGDKTLSGELTQLAIETTVGVYDAGSISVFYR